MNRREVERLVADVAPGLRKLVAREVATALAEVEARCSRHEEKLLALESRPVLKYAGTWNDGATYDSGSLVTRNGGLWVAEVTTADRPGDGATAWRLVVKSGKA